MSEAADVPLFDVVGAEGNRRYGHIAVGTGVGPAEGAFCDMGPVLRLWAHTSGDFTPAAARNLAAELIAWADRKDRATLCACLSCRGARSWQGME